MSQFRIREYRVYEGEWRFFCCKQDCQGYLLEYSLNEYESHAENFLNHYGAHSYEGCHLCGDGLVWASYSGGSPISILESTYASDSVEQ